MARSTFKVLFYLKRQAEQNGKAPIMGRITINGTISQFSCKLSISPKLWDTKANKATGKSVVAQRINEKLENIKTNIGKQYQRICDRDSYVTAEKVKNAWLGFGDGYQLLLQTFDEYLNDFEKNRVGKDRKASTLENYRKQYRRLAAFLQYEYKLEDIPFRELKREFIEKYVVYRRTVSGSCFAAILRPGSLSGLSCPKLSKPRKKTSTNSAASPIFFIIVWVQIFVRPTACLRSNASLSSYRNADARLPVRQEIGAILSFGDYSSGNGSPSPGHPQRGLTPLRYSRSLSSR